MPFVPIIVAVAAVLAFLSSVFNSFLIMSIVKPLLSLFIIAAGALLVFTLFALVRKYFVRNGNDQEDHQ